VAGGLRLGGGAKGAALGIRLRSGRVENSTKTMHTTNGVVLDNKMC